ncbi:parvalbumin 9 [Synchiropus picturatus]
MSIDSILSAEAIKEAVTACQDSFSYKKFFQLCGLTSKTPQEIKEVFNILDGDNSGFIEEPELEFFLQRFAAGSRKLSESERQSIMADADYNGDGKIGVDEFHNLVEYSK